MDRAKNQVRWSSPIKVKYILQNLSTVYVKIEKALELRKLS